MHINLEHAQKVIEAARKKAVSLKTQECIAVVDSGANLKAFLRMDDAWVGSMTSPSRRREPRVYLPCPRVSSASCPNQESRSMASSIPMTV